MISVCIPTYNGEKYLVEQIQSILTQLGESDEIIVSDDLSTDSSIDILQNLQDSRIRILRNSKNLVTIYNLESALAEAKGEFVFLSDQDDIWAPNKVKKSLEALENADLVLHNAFILKNGNREDKTLFDLRNSKKGFWKNWVKNSYIGCCMAFRASILKDILPFPPKLPMHDQWIGLRAEQLYKIKLLPQCLIDYRIHDSNATQSSEKSKHSFRQQLSWRYHLLKAVFKRSSTRS